MTLLRISALGILLSATVVLLPATNELTAQGVPGRRMEPGRWELVSRVDPEGELLLDPQLVASVGDSLVVFDYGDFALKAFDRSGRQLWTAGRRGGGPGEFGNPMSLNVDLDGVVWVNDPANGRVSRFTRGGRFIDQVTVTEQLTFVLPLLGRRFAAVGNFERHNLMQIYDSTGRVLRDIPLPDSLKSVPLINRQAYMSGTDQAVNVFFRFSDVHYVVTPSTGSVREYHGPEQVRFASPVAVSTQIDGRAARITRANPRAVKATLTVVAGTARTISLLFGGTTADSGRVLDDYEPTGGRYVGSRRIPARAIALTNIGADVAAIVPDPVPSIYVWRWVPTGSGRNR